MHSVLDGKAIRVASAARIPHGSLIVENIHRSSDKFGRKRTIQAGCVWALWGCAMQAGAPNIACLLIGRIVAGVAIGILSMVVPLYNVGTSIMRVRGVCTYQM